MGTRHVGERPTGAAIRFGWAILIPTAVAALIGMVLLWPSGMPETGAAPDGTAEVTGTIVGIDKRPCPPVDEAAADLTGPPPPYCGDASVRLADGEDAGELIFVSLPTGPGAPVVDLDEDVVLMYLPGVEGGQYSYHIVDHDRETSLWIVLAAFGLAVIAFGRWRGLLALAGLGVSFAVLLLFIVPGIISGQPPLLVAIVGSAVIMLAVLYLSHGFRATTTIAVLGTMASLILTGLLAWAAVGITHLTGIADEDTTYLSASQGVNMRGLLLAGILIGALGALDDVTVTQSTAVAELARANPRYRPWRLYRAAARIGRSHIASVVNTLILAYAGASLPLLILIAAADRPFGQVVTTQLIAEEVVRSAVGTLGLIAAVPLTTWLAAISVRRFWPSEPEPEPEPESDAAVPGPRPAAPKREWLDLHADEV